MPDESPAADNPQYTRHPAEYAAMPVDGDYESAAQKKPFHLEVRYGDIHIFSGWRFKKQAYKEDGNVVYWEKERLLREVVQFIRDEGEVELGSCADNRTPGPDTLEAFLRKFSINGNLSSYLPAVLERLGAVRIEKRAKGIHWVVPGDRVEAQNDPEQD